MANISVEYNFYFLVQVKEDHVEGRKIYSIKRYSFKKLLILALKRRGKMSDTTWARCADVTFLFFINSKAMSSRITVPVT